MAGRGNRPLPAAGLVRLVSGPVSPTLYEAAAASMHIRSVDKHRNS